MIKIISGYDINELLYESSNSLVYRAQRQSDKQAVIVKMLSEAYPSPEKIAWFKREYKVTRDLNLAGVPEVYSYESEQNRWLMVLEDFGGESLRRLELRGTLELADFLTLAIKVTDILGQIHAKQIMHKDINPANIVFNSTTGQVKLIDFGISTVLERENPTFKNPNVLEGTLSYISPEQTGRMNRPVDYRTDFYSLGVTFYELLTGQLPFESDEPLELVHCHLAKQPVPPHDLLPDIPRAISSIVLKLMAKNAQERYQSASGLKADLETCLRQWSVGSIMPFALGQQDNRGRFQIPAKLYGREQESKILQAAFERVSTGVTEMMLVAGYSGIGKSALVQEVYKPITLVRGCYLAGKFDQFQRDIPYAAFIQAFRSLMRQLLTESDAQIAQWREKLQTALGSLGQIISRVIPEVELIIGPQPDVPELAPTQAQNRFNLAFQNFISVFTQAKHSLVIFLDDLQWADRASLNLINLLMTAGNSTDSQGNSLFLIGAYRDNEVSSTHSLMMTLDEIKKSGATLNQITLSELALPDIAQLIAETLHCNKERAQPLAELVYSKTGGNPFFLREFLKSLYSQSLLTFDYQQGVWQWNLAQIQAEEITDNVVELMASQVKQLPHQTQAVLKFAACVGNQFDLQTLALVYQKSPAQTATDLSSAMREGLLLPLTDAYKVVELDVVDLSVPSFVGTGLGTSLEFTAEYKFVHDRVQQAVYSLIDEAEKQATHLEVGRQLLDHMPIETREKRIFDIANNFNKGCRLIENKAERDQLAELNLRAGRKAKASAAIQPAFNYLQVGLALLGEDHWHRQYELTLALYVEAAKAAYLCGDFEQMEHLTDSVLREANSLLDKVKVVEVRILAYYAQNKPLYVIQTTLQILSLLGVTFPENPSQLDVEQALSETEAALASKPVKALAFLPEMKDPEKMAAMRILQKGINAAYVAASHIRVLFTCKIVNLSLQYGMSANSCVGFAHYGLIVCTVLGNIESGYQFGQLALRLVERFKAKELKSRILFVFNGAIRHWREHLRETLPSLQEGYQIGVETGDFFSAAYGLLTHTFAHAYYAGKELTKLEQEMVKHRSAINQLKQVQALHGTDRYRQSALNLMGRSQNPSLLCGEAYDAQKMLPIYHQTNNKTLIFSVHFQSLHLSYLFGEYQQAANHALLGAQYLDNIVGLLPYPVFHFYASLAWLAVYALRAAPEAEQKALLEKVAANQEKMELWAQHAPMNYLHKFYLVEAERARVLGEDGQAREYYDQAIDLARENQYINEEALAYELAGKFYLAKGRTQVAELYLRNAHYAYQRWGALAKVKQLEEKYPVPSYLGTSLLQATPTERRTTNTAATTGTRATTSLDIESVLKANQAIAGEIQLAALLEKMIKIVIENAGAERGLLILEKDGQWVIEAEGTIDRTDMMVLQNLPILPPKRSAQASSDLLPLSMVNYVLRTQEHVVLDEATQEGQFAADPYIVARRPKSILCMPLINQGRLTAILYLENNLTTGAFTPDRLEVLNLLSSQAAISLENATLYSTLEQKVEERTVELQHEIVERKRAEEAANKANQAKSHFLASMSHELRTPLNGILGYAQILKRDYGLREEQQHGLSIIESSGKHLLMLINDVLDLAKVESGTIDLYQTDFHLPFFLDSVAQLIRIRATHKGLTFRLQHPESLPLYVHGDERRLRQILLNLLGNAVKFTDHGHVTLKVAPPHPNPLPLGEGVILCFEVIDTGIGISAEDIETIFEPFKQAGQIEQQMKGTGLGLAISRNLIQIMGGQLQVESTLGKGSCFWFELPIALSEQPNAERLEDSQTIVGFSGEVEQVLIVDDNWNNRAVLVDLLTQLGFQTIEAENGRAALTQATAQPPTLIITDLLMPEMNGFELIQTIRQTASLQHIPIIATSASVYKRDQHKSLAAGSDAFLPKPIEAESLLQLLQRLLPIKWLYQESELQAGQAELAPAMILPSVDILKMLLDDAESGDIGALRDHLRELQQTQPQLNPFITPLQEFARSFKMNKISALLKESLRE